MKRVIEAIVICFGALGLLAAIIGGMMLISDVVHHVEPQKSQRKHTTCLKI